MAEPIIVGIGGPSGSGKTTIADALAQRLGPERCAVIRLDSYYRDLAHLPAGRRAAWNFDAPDSIEIELLVRDIEVLSRGLTIESPTYSFVTHSRNPETVSISPRHVVIVEGTLALHWSELREQMAIRAYVHADEALCFERRVRRDVSERGRSVTGVRDQWRSTVWPMHLLYVLPSRAYADIVLDGTHTLEAAAALEDAIGEEA